VVTELERQLARLKQGNHVCPIYESMAEQPAAAIPFIEEGLARGERCLYVIDDRSAELIGPALMAAGVDVAHERQRGVLWLPTKRETHLRSGLEAVLRKT
jgi:DcmR-like sensory protein